MGFGFSPGCCCDAACAVLTDDFHRADSTSLGADWSEVAGDWSVASNRLTVSGGSRWLRTTAAAGTDTHGYGTVQAVCRSSAAGDQLRVGFGDSGASTPAVYAELTVGGAGTAKLRIKDSGGTTLGECDVTAAINVDHTVKLCVQFSDVPAPDEDYFAAAWLNGVRLLAAYVSINFVASSYGWLGTGTITGTPVFDDFEFNTLAGRVYNTDCPTCLHCCWPHTDEMPDQIQVDIAGATGGGFGECSGGECTALNGTYVLDKVATVGLECARYELDISQACDGSTIDQISLTIHSDLSSADAPQGCHLHVEFHYDGFGAVVEGELSSHPGSVDYVAGEQCGTNTPTIPLTYGVQKCGGATATLTPL